MTLLELLEKTESAIGRELLDDEIVAAARLLENANEQAETLLIELCGGRPPELPDERVKTVGYEPTRVQIVIGSKGKVRTVSGVRKVF